MVTAQVTDVEYYNHLVDNDQVGFSIEGYLGMKLKEVSDNHYFSVTYPNCCVTNVFVK